MLLHYDEVSEPTPDDVVEVAARREAARVIGMLVRLLGSLDRAEEIFQESLVAALEHWRVEGVPQNPGAWLSQVAKNRALDELRRDRLHQAKHEVLAREPPGPAAAPALAEEIPDDRLRLVFTCCHPALARESQVAITLRLVCGLTTGEIARAFLVSEPTIAQRLVRAKRTIHERRLPYVVPARAELAERLTAVLTVVYLVFNEGYSASGGLALQRVDVAREAIQLGAVLAELLPAEAEVHGLVALMHLQASRGGARTDAEGNLVLLEDQDRGRWDQARITRGLAALERARATGPAGPYRLQAEIAACHAVAATWADTDWTRIAALYADLVRLVPSPVIELNRAVAVSMVEGPAAGLAIVDGLAGEPRLRDYHLLPATRADLLRRTGAWSAARAEYARARSLTQNRSEQEFLARREAECDARARDESPVRRR
jgi:RNA polymerase sigma factor (sigma-70 family)